MRSRFQSLMSEGADALGLSLEAEGIERLWRHRELLERWADRVNLTTVRELDGQVDRLYLDSALVLPHLDPGARVHDVGTGAGFPGLVLKALRLDLRVTLSEARHKRVTFLRAAIREMGLAEGEGLEVRWGRLGWSQAGPAEEVWQEVISRAVAPPAEWVQGGASLVAPGGRLWIMSGSPHADSEPDPSASGEPSGWRLAEGFRLESTWPYRLPFCGLERQLVALRRA